MTVRGQNGGVQTYLMSPWQQPYTAWYYSASPFLSWKRSAWCLFLKSFASAQVVTLACFSSVSLDWRENVFSLELSLVWIPPEELRLKTCLRSNRPHSLHPEPFFSLYNLMRFTSAYVNTWFVFSTTATTVSTTAMPMPKALFLQQKRPWIGLTSAYQLFYLNSSSVTRWTFEALIPGFSGLKKIS